MNDALGTEPIPFRDLAPWLFPALFLVALVYLVGLDQGGLSHTGNWLHELMHDGRHLLGVPCH